jgi:hypothetical protein
MARPKKACSVCTWLQKLQAEQFDTSYKNHPATSLQTSVEKPVKKPVENDDRDKLMFNAGRYAGGATDDVALLAHLKLQQLLDN